MPRDRTAELLEAAKSNGYKPEHNLSANYGALSSAKTLPSPRTSRSTSLFPSLHSPSSTPNMNSSSSPSVPPRRNTVPINSTSSSAQSHPHSFVVHTYKGVTDCRLCGKMLFGFRTQGYKCLDCNFDCHEKCRSAADREMPCGGATRGDSEHDFAPKTFLRPTDCMICAKLLVGFSKQGLECSHCSMVVHEKCRMNAGPCTGEPVIQISSGSSSRCLSPVNTSNEGTGGRNTPECTSREDPFDGLWEELATEAMATANELKGILEQTDPVIDTLWSLYDQDIKEYLPDEKRKLRHQIQEIVSSLNATQAMVVKGMNNLKPKAGEPGYLQQIKSLHYESVNSQFKALVKRLSEMEDKYMKATDSRTMRLREITQDTGDDTLVFCMLSTDVFVQEYEEIQERHEQLKNVEKGLAEILQMQVLMARLVDDQQAAIDRIENTTAATAAKVETVIQELRATRELQSAARKKKAIFGGIVGVAAVGGAAKVAASVAM